MLPGESGGYPAGTTGIALSSGPNPEQWERLAMPTAAMKATAHNANQTGAVSHPVDVTDRMHGLLMDRADGPEETELA